MNMSDNDTFVNADEASLEDTRSKDNENNHLQRDSALGVHLTKSLGECYTLYNAINVGPRQCRHPIAQDGGVAPLEEDAESAPQVGGCLGLLLPRVPGQGSTQFLHLPFCP